MTILESIPQLSLRQLKRWLRRHKVVKQPPIIAQVRYVVAPKAIKLAFTIILCIIRTRTYVPATSYIYFAYSKNPLKTLLKYT